MKTKAEPRKHIKMYSDDEFIELLKNHAKKEGLTASAYIFTTMKTKIKRAK